SAWSDAARGLGLSGELTEEEVFAVFDVMTQLVREVEKAEGFRRWVVGIQCDAARFAEDVAAQCRRYLPDAASLPPAEASERLVRAVERARVDQAERVRLTAELASAESALEQSLLKRRDAEQRLAALLVAARVDSPALLK